MGASSSCVVGSSPRCGAPGASPDGTGSVVASGDDVGARDVEVPTPVAAVGAPGPVALSLWTDGSRLTPGGRGAPSPGRRGGGPNDVVVRTTSAPGPAAGGAGDGGVAGGCVETPVVGAGGVGVDGSAVRGGVVPDGGVTVPETVGAIGSTASPAVPGVASGEKGAGPDIASTVPAAGRATGGGSAVRCTKGGAGGGAVTSGRSGAEVTGSATEGSTGGGSSHAGAIAAPGGGANERRPSGPVTASKVPLGTSGATKWPRRPSRAGLWRVVSPVSNGPGPNGPGPKVPSAGVTIRWMGGRLRHSPRWTAGSPGAPVGAGCPSSGRGDGSARGRSGCRRKGLTGCHRPSAGCRSRWISPTKR